MSIINNSERTLESALHPGDNSTYPARVIIIYDRDALRYSTHIEVCPKDREPFLLLGHYDLTEGQALIDFANRVKSL